MLVFRFTPTDEDKKEGMFGRGAKKKSLIHFLDF